MGLLEIYKNAIARAFFKKTESDAATLMRRLKQTREAILDFVSLSRLSLSLSLSLENEIFELKN